MKTMTAAEAKNKFGQFLDSAQREPVLVTKNDRPVGVFVSMADLENSIWRESALRAHFVQDKGGPENALPQGHLSNRKG